MMLLLVGAAMYFMTRKASAKTLTSSGTMPIKDQYAAYGAGKQTLLRVPTPAQAPRATDAPLSALINSGFNFLNARANAPGPTMPGYATDYNIGALGSGVSAEFDGTAGEAQAAIYYNDHRADFETVAIDYDVINSTPWAQAALNDPSEY